MATVAAPAINTSALDLSIQQRQTVKIDGVQYELLSSDELALLVYRNQARKWRRLGQLMELETQTPEEEKELEVLLDRFIRHVLIAPEEVHQKLRTGHRLSIAGCFIALLLNLQAQPAAATGKGSRRPQTRPTPRSSTSRRA